MHWYFQMWRQEIAKKNTIGVYKVFALVFIIQLIIKASSRKMRGLLCLQGFLVVASFPCWDIYNMGITPLQSSTQLYPTSGNVTLIGSLIFLPCFMLFSKI